MINDSPTIYCLRDSDLKVFDLLLPYDHVLQDFLNVIDWANVSSILRGYYSPDQGRPGIPPLIMIKLEFLRYYYRLGDAEVIERSRSDIAFRWFLQLPVRCEPPDATTLCKFRARIGAEGFQKVFNQIIQQARDAGIIKDRLRLKDASHVIAAVAVPSTLQLLGQLRDRFLKEIAELDISVAEGFRVSAELIREQTAKLDASIRLEKRVELLRDILVWIDQFKPADVNASAWQQLMRTRRIAEKILDDQTSSDASDKILSLFDTEARRGMHGDWFDGYKVDMLVDADSELITRINVIAACGDEAMNAVALIEGEQQTFGNQIEEMSIDKAGYNGAMIRALEDSEKANVRVIVPPKALPATGFFTSENFVLSEDGSQVRCPSGQSSVRRTERKDGRRVLYTFSKAACAACPLLSQCMKQLPKARTGRAVSKNEYEVEYKRMEVRSTTEHYRDVRREHHHVERKFNETLNRHFGRRAHYFGTAKVTIQELMAAMTTNVKRIVKLLAVSPCTLSPQ